MFAIYRNSYLQSQISSVNPRIINRCVDKARDEPIIADCSYFEPPFFRVTSEQPEIPTEGADPTRRPVAFGRWALPKLRREIHDDSELTVIQALLSIYDLVRDPERAYEAIHLRIPDRLSDLLLEVQPPIREGAVLCLLILAEYYFGKEAIIANEFLTDNLFLALGDEQISVRLKVAACFEMMARSWMIADVLVDRGLLQTLLEIIEKGELQEIIGFHLDTLKSLMYDCGKCIAVKENGFRIFQSLLDHESSTIIGKALDCLAIITSTKKGKKLAIRKKLLQTLTRLIHYENDEICTKATSVIMFCTVKTRAKFLAAEIKSLPKRLVKLATNPLNVSLQMFALKALTNITEHPEIRKRVLERYFEELTNLKVSECNQENKKILLSTVSWVPEKLG